MGGLTFTPENTPMQVPVLSKELSFGDSLAPTTPTESGLTGNFNFNTGLIAGPSTDFGIYAEAAWSGTEQHAPATGENGTLGIVSSYAATGIRVDAGRVDNPALYVRGGAALTFGDSEWSPPSTETVEYPDEVFNVDTGEWSTIGTIVETYDIAGTHEFTGPTTTLGVDGYADTRGQYNITAAGQTSRDVGSDVTATGRAVLGINNEDGGYAGVGAIIQKPIAENWNIYGGGQIYVTQEDGLDSSAIAGIRGTLNLGEGAGIFSQVPVYAQAEQDLNGGGTDVTVGVSIFQHNF